jgi:hypothetical protein
MDLRPLAAVVLVLVARSASSGPITAEAHGSSSPTPSFSAPLANGDFTIDTLYSFPIGDGEDDWTTWTFDLAADPGFLSFPTARPLAVARLTLELTPGHGLVASDEVSIEGLAPIASSAIHGLPVGVTSTVELDLLAHYSSAEILGELDAGSGALPMLYQDDAIVSYARLDLESVPEPASAVLLLLGGIILGLAAARRRWHATGTAMLLIASSASAASISAEAWGSASPPVVHTVPLVNGDFVLTHPYPLSFPVGDGVDDETRWVFDFAGNPDFESFATTRPLRRAQLTLTLSVGHYWIRSDEVSIEGLAPIQTPAIQMLPVGVTRTVEIELLGYYSSAEILGRLVAESGSLSMYYQDDAIVSFARLELESVPEPSSFLLVFAGIAALGRIRRG